MRKPPRRGTLYVCPVVNTMGPVVDARHSDLLNDWDAVDLAIGRIFDEEYRARYPDSAGHSAIFSWFFISWSGFSSNPVQRDFGWFNVYDHYRARWGEAMARHGDDMFWMYNHPPKSGIGNEWGLDWLHNAHYLEILMRYVAERAYFPGVVEVVTEKNDASHFLENFFPFDLGNRNSVDVDWHARNADGKPMWEVIDWRAATHGWETYTPAEDDYQRRGRMKRRIGRLLDIKTIVYHFKEYEVEKAFHHCLEGHDAIISAYEHDFRDRAAVIEEMFLGPLHRISRRYPEIEWRYATSRDAFAALNPEGSRRIPTFRLRADAHGNLLLRATAPIFGPLPFTFYKRGERYTMMPFLRVGEAAWLLSRDLVDAAAELFVAANNPVGRSTIQRFSLDRYARPSRMSTTRA